MITVNDTIKVLLDKEELNQCIDNAKLVLENLIDRKDLHKRDDLERFNNILMGEIAEFMVIKWLNNHKKYVKSSVDKSSGVPDLGYDIELKKKGSGKIIKCSVKSSLSFKKGLDGIVQEFKLATTQNELRDVNIQVYFWLELNPPKNTSRTTVTSLNNSSIIGWFGAKDLESFSSYNHEKRKAPETPLSQARPMMDLLNFIE
ncbi:hypothetical protein [Mannheimia haemolytica]|uniref:hypothetical protein n=1 Tax=Mannheimia haemolytica TaxID=75985 RepID=UPI00201BE04D|nr:hypothetical protein [Mannheimia haemolytica]UQX69369.1 hypothetical protein M3705_10325 [Mannheimia haemolytica]